MNLICPHCQKRVSVSDTLAGHTATCNFCSGPFTVPMPPDSGVSSSPAMSYSAGSSYANRTGGSSAVMETFAPAPPTNSESRPDLPPPMPSAAVSAEYRRHLPLVLSPPTVRWIAPACVILIFLFQFVPWVGVYAGDETVARQLGVGVAFGSVKIHANQYVPALDKIASTPLVLYFFLMFGGFFLAIGVIFVATASPSVRASIPPWVNKLLPWRPVILGGLCLLAFLFILPYTVVQFPFENKALENSEKVYEGVVKAATELKVVRSELISEAWLQRRGWFGMVVFLNFMAVLAAAADFWLQRRGRRPLPRALLEW